MIVILLKQKSTRLADWRKAAIDTGSEVPLYTQCVDGATLQRRRINPDLIEGDHGELASPVQCDAETHKCGDELVAAVLAAVKAEVTCAPYTVNTVKTIGFGQNILELNLNR